jgi:two-component system chemotaxis response regulator CheY
MVIAKRKLPSIVFSDLWMPNMDGLTFLQQMKADSDLKQIPIIVVTANAHQESVVAAHRLGAAGFLRKPIREKCLARELKKRLPDAEQEGTAASCQE